MGFVRFFLAISVVLVHLGASNQFVGGKNAVQIFYMLSGFLISFILNENDSYKSVSHFYVNRFLRIFPMYYIIVIFALFLELYKYYNYGQSYTIYTIHHVPLFLAIAIVISNITIFFQDWLMFVGVQDGVAQFTRDFTASSPQVWNGLLAPQAWSLGIELCFYLIAPFIIRKRMYVIFVFILSLFIRYYLYESGIGIKDPWTYRFFPSELGLFMFGAMAHMFLYRAYKSASVSLILPASFTLLSVLYILFYTEIPKKNIISLDIYIFVYFFIALPFLFIINQQFKIDRYIGNLSYPIYICHIFVIKLLDQFGIDSKGGTMEILIILVATVAFSMGLHAFIESHIEVVRNSFRFRAVVTKPIPPGDQSGRC